VNIRDRDGRPRCAKCPPDDGRDPVDTVVDVVAGIDPTLSADAVAAAVKALVPQAGQRHQLAWAVQDRPDLLTGAGAETAVPSVLRLIDDVRGLLGRWLPEVVRDNRSYLTVAIGCTGGRHRSVYLAERLSRGSTLGEALQASLTDFDGSFSYLAATPQALGFAKDPFALKPLLITETETFVAVATEEIAIRAACEGTYMVREAQAREVQVWQR